MKSLFIVTLMMTAPFVLGCAAARGGSGSSPPGESSEHGAEPALAVTPRAGQKVVPGDAKTFTGAVEVRFLFAATEHTRAAAASVSFEPSARTAWHSHPAGQTLVVTSGTGWVQQWGGAKQAIHEGDVIWTTPGVKHWHGAAATTAMTHLAIQEHVDGKVVDWMEHVADEQYAR